MAASTVAAVLGEDRHDLVGEVDRDLGIETLDTDLQLGFRATLSLGRDCCFPVSHRPNVARGIDCDDPGGFGAVRHLLGPVPERPRAVTACDDQLLPGISAYQDYFRAPGFDIESYQGIGSTSRAAGPSRFGGRATGGEEEHEAKQTVAAAEQWKNQRRRGEMAAWHGGFLFQGGTLRGRKGAACAAAET